MIQGLERRINVIDQVLFFERFAQVANRSAMKHLSLQSLVRKSGNEYHWDAVTVGNQPILQLDPAQAGHLHIGDQTGRGRHLPRFEEFLGGTKGQSLVAERSDEGLSGFSDGFIVVNDRDHLHLLQFHAPGPLDYRPGGYYDPALQTK